MPLHDGPALVQVGVVADDLAGDHECGDEETVARGATGGGGVNLEAAEEVEGCKSDGERKTPLLTTITSLMFMHARGPLLTTRSC